MPAARRRLYLIDGYSDIYRAFYALPPFTNSKGLQTNAVYGFLNMLRKLQREESPELIGVAMDLPGETVRSERYEEYKANRKPMPEELRPQIPWVRRALEALRIPVLEQQGYEADDVLGTLARKAQDAGYDVVLVSADKDLLQLVGDHVSLYHTGRERLYDPEGVTEDFGVPPQRVTDVLALMGDSSDNVPGVKGIGVKGAVALVREFGSLEELLARVAEVSRKSYREGLEKHREEAELSKELVTIHTDLPLDLDPEGLVHDEPDPDALREVYRELEFTSFLKELGAAVGSQEPVGAAEEVGGPEEWRERTCGVGRVAVVGLVEAEAPRGLAVDPGEDTPVLFADFRRSGMEAAARASVREWLEDRDRRVVGHDLKEVLRWVGSEVRPVAELFDTMLVSYVLQPALRGHGLLEVALDRIQVHAVGAKEAGWDRGEEPPLGAESLLVFAAERARLPRRLAAGMKEELEGDLEKVYREIEEPLIPVLLSMEERGILLDTEFLASLSEELGAEMAGLEEEIYEIAGDPFNIHSPAQLGEVLFERLGYPVIKKTRKTKSYSTDADTLQQLAIQGYPLPEKLLKYRELAKLKSTYVDALPTLVSGDGRLHTRYHQAVAATGRLSSANPNLQNIPVRTEQGRRIRRAFAAPEGRRLLVADYSQIELRVLAHIAEEPELVRAFEAGEDIHRATAAAVFDVAPDLVTADQRRAAKVINFGILYGMSPFGLSQNLGIPQDQAKRFIETYLGRYEGVKRYMDETVASARETGKVETLYGRVRWLPEIKSRNWNVRENARRMAINARIQGTAADLLKKAMIAVDRRLLEEHPEAWLLLTVHDELVLEVPEGEVNAVRDLVVAEMEGVTELAVPLVVDTGVGATWWDAKA